MFAAVEFLKANLSFKGKLYDYFSLPQIISIRVEVPDALPFFTVKIKEHKGKIPFSAAENVMGKLCDSVIYKKDSAVPEECPFQRFEGYELKKKMLFNSAVNYIKSLTFDPLSQHITVFDEKAELTKEIERLVFLTNKIQIVTKEKGRYQSTAKFLMEKYGVSLIVSNSFVSAVKDSTFIISDKSDMIPIYYKGTLFTNEKKHLSFGRVLIGEGITLPIKYGELIPEGFDEMEFALALYEKCGVKQLEKLSFDTLLLT